MAKVKSKKPSKSAQKDTKNFKASITWVPTDKVIPYKNNAKKHPDDQIEELARQINEFGFSQPIVVDKNMVIIAGHGRHIAAKSLTLKEVPVIVADHLTADQTKAMRIADNKVASTKYDRDALRFELGSLERIDFDFTLTGIEAEEISYLFHLNEQDDVKDSHAKEQNANVKNSKPAKEERPEPRTISFLLDQGKADRMQQDLDRLQAHFGVATNADVVQKLIVYFDSGGIFNGEGA